MVSRLLQNCGIHDPSRQIFLREFINALVRIAFVCAPSFDRLSDAVVQILDFVVFSLFSKNKKLRSTGRHPQLVAPVKDAAVNAIFATFSKPLRALFNKYAIRHSINDEFLPAKRFLQMLKV